MRKAFCLLAILLTSTAMAQWVYAPNPDECVNPETGQRFNPSADGRRKTAIACETVNDFQVWDGLVDWLLAFLTDEAKAQIVATVGSSGQPGSGDTSSPAAPSTWTEVFQGDAAGNTIENTSTSLTIIADSTNDLNNRTMLCQAITTDQDFQIEATIPGPSSWTGHIEDYTGFGIVFLEDRTTTASEYWQIWISNISGLSFKHDAAAPSAPWDEFYPALPISSYTVALTYDDSQDDVRAFYSEDGGTTWIEFAQRTGDSLTFGANSAACVFGTSHLSGAETTALITGAVLSGTIDAYTPGTPPAGPVWTQVPNQGLTQGTAWSLDYTAYVTCGDPPCTYSATGFPGSTGLSVSSAGAGSGTPNANDVSGSPFNVTVTATDNSANSANETHQFTVAASTGTDFLIATGTSLVNCETISGGPVAPGDTITLDGTSRGTIRFINCNGNSQAPITIRNDTTETAALTISSTAQWPFEIDDSTHVVVDGTGKWSGAPAGTCGVTVAASGLDISDGLDTCGIIVSDTGGTNCTQVVKIRGISEYVTLKGMEVAGSGSPSDCSNIDVNDHAVKNSDPDNPTNWREGIVITQNYVHDAGREGIYFCSNQNSSQQDDWPCRGNTISYNYVLNSGWDGIEIKSQLDGSGADGWSEVHHNLVVNSGTDGTNGPGQGNNGHGISLFESGYTNVYNNEVDVTDQANGAAYGTCITQYIQNASNARWGTLPTSIYGNLVRNCRGSGIASGRQDSADAVPEPTIYNDTIHLTGGSGLSCNSLVSSSGVLRNNIVAGGSIATGGQCSSTANSTAAASSQGFVSVGNTTPRTGDYSLGAGSTNINAISSGCPSGSDQEGVAWDATCNRGAFNNVP